MDWARGDPRHVLHPEGCDLPGRGAGRYRRGARPAERTKASPHQIAATPNIPAPSGCTLNAKSAWSKGCSDQGPCRLVRSVGQQAPPRLSATAPRNRRVAPNSSGTGAARASPGAAPGLPRCAHHEPNARRLVRIPSCYNTATIQDKRGWSADFDLDRVVSGCTVRRGRRDLGRLELSIRIGGSNCQCVCPRWPARCVSIVSRCQGQWSRRAVPVARRLGRPAPRRPICLCAGPATPATTTVPESTVDFRGTSIRDASLMGGTGGPAKWRPVGLLLGVGGDPQ